MVLPGNRAQHRLFFCCTLALSVLLLVAGVARAQEFTSASYRTLNPVMSAGGYGSSDSFKLYGEISGASIGTSTSASFGSNAGFLMFPFVSTPVISATAGNASAALSWTTASGYLGWTPTSYAVGKATVSGGPYTFLDAVSGLSTTASGLTNGTAYYFVVRVLDAFSNVIATSTQVSATPADPCAGVTTCGVCGNSACSSGSSGSGGGGGGGSFTPSTPTSGAVFSGRAYPKTTVTLLKDAQVAATTIAGADAMFSITLSGLSGGNYIFSVYSEDNKGTRSSLLTFPISITSGATTNVGGIFIAPTISVDKSEVKRGDTITIFGQSIPQADIIIAVNSEEEFFSKTISDKNGVYLYNFDSSLLEYGSHAAKSKAAIGNQLVTGFSYLINFKVGTKNVLAQPQAQTAPKGDSNNDKRVNLIDFSIMAYYWTG